MSRKFVLTESEVNEIRKMYGLVSEQNKLMQSYDGTLLNFCGYRAIEKFEETFGNASGQSMGDDYFEGKLEDWEKYIRANIEDSIGLDVFDKFPEKLKMQIWSFMFNTPDAENKQYRWLAGLAQAVNAKKLTNSNIAAKYRLAVMNPNSPEHQQAITDIRNYKDKWENILNTYLTVLDTQYKSIALNNNKGGSYRNSWSIRPSYLNNFYDECSNNKSPKQVTQTSNIATQKKPSTSEQQITFHVEDSKTRQGLDNLYKKFKEFVNSRIEESGAKYDFKDFQVKTLDKIHFAITLVPSKEGYDRMTILFNEVGKPTESLNRAMELNKDRNPKILKKGVIRGILDTDTQNVEDFEYHVVGFK